MGKIKNPGRNRGSIKMGGDILCHPPEADSTICADGLIRLRRIGMGRG